MPLASADTHVKVVPSQSLGFPRTGNAFRVEFAGIADMVREAQQAQSERPDLAGFLDHTDGHWIGRQFSSFADVVKAVDGTWAEGVDRVEEMSRELEREELPRPTVIKRKRVWDDAAGDEICVDRWRAADPFFRTNSRRPTTGPRIITILTQLGQNAHMESEKLFWRGALTLALARILEDAGYRTEITTFGMTEGTYTDRNCADLAMVAKLKEADDVLDVSSLVNATSGWFFRTVYFGAMFTPRASAYASLGRMKEATPQMVEDIAGPQARPWLVSGVYDKATSLALARKLLGELASNS